MFENGETLLVGEMTGASPPTFRHRIPERGVSAPVLPPRPSRPSLPPKPSFSGSGDLPSCSPSHPRPCSPSQTSRQQGQSLYTHPLSHTHTLTPYSLTHTMYTNSHTLQAPFVPSRERASSDSMFPVKSRPPSPAPWRSSPATLETPKVRSYYITT